MKVTRTTSVSVALALALFLVVMIGAVATAAAVSPVTHSGNTPKGCDLKIEGPAGGSYAIPGQPGKYVSITVSAYGEGQQLAFSSDLPVLKVYVKGGPNGYNEYNYGADGLYSDSGLRCPANKRGSIPAISHVCLYFGQGTTTTSGETPTTSSTIFGDLGDTTTTSSTIVEDTGGTTTTSSTEVDDTGDSTTTSTDKAQHEETTSTTEQRIGDAESGGGQPTISEIQTGGSSSGGPGAGTWALGMLALALAGGLGWTALVPVLKRR